MIEIGVAKSGDKIVKLNGRSLSSQYNPVAEASGWAKQQQKQLTLSSNVFVLGLGGGYHVSSLHQLYSGKNFLVIEPEPELFKFFEENFQLDAAAVKVVLADSAEEILSNSDVKSMLKTPYVVVRPPCFDEKRVVFFNDLQDVLLARSVPGLKRFLKLRPDLSESFSLSKNRKVYSTDSTLSIKDLCQNVAPGQAKEKSIAMALRELVR